MAEPLLSIVIPVFNERDNLPLVLERVAAAPYDKEVVVVDDRSTDGTREWLSDLSSGKVSVPGLDPARTVVVLHEKNGGKGAALRSGFARVGGRFVVIQDADLEYDPSDYPLLLEPLLKGRADAVFGTRFAGGGAHRVLLFWHSIGNRLVTLLSNIFTNLNLTDMETGYKVFRREVVQRIRIRSNRFGVEPELTAKCVKLKCRIYEVPISYHGRTYEQGKKLTWRDGPAALFHIVRFHFFD
jgi:glycosyltransferase involved in cell wall biosynthesis